MKNVKYKFIIIFLVLLFIITTEVLAVSPYELDNELMENLKISSKVVFEHFKNNYGEFDKYIVAYSPTKQVFLFAFGHEDSLKWNSYTTGVTGKCIFYNAYDGNITFFADFSKGSNNYGDSFSICYANYNVTDGQTNNTSYFLENPLPFNYESEDIIFDITLSTAEETNNPVTAYSNYFAYEDAFKYECYISTDSINWKLMNYETLTDNGTTKFRFNYVILENGTYYFKLLNKETQEESYITREITNILKNSSNSGYSSSGIPQPFVNYERVGEYFVLKTQSFTKDEIIKYKCLYTNSFTEDYSTWSDMSIGSLENTQLGQTEYYFFISIPKDSENCTYYFVFYDYDKQEYGAFSSLDCDFEEMNKYSDEVAGVIEEKKNRFNELLDFFKERFGFLTYPFEFIADLLNRILNIDYKEPIIKIPEMYSPGTDIKIFDGYEYNFNTLLENKAVSNIYNIYLIAVDFVIIIGVIVLAKNTLMEVFGNG